MMIPNIPNMPIVEKDGNCSPEWWLFFTQLTTELQLNLSNQGFKLPALTTVEINALDPTIANGNMVLDTTLNQMKVALNGAWRVVTVT